MKLKKEKRKAVSINPSTLLLYGAPKVGKTTMLSQLDDCLIIDTEKGSRMVEGYIQEVNSRDELIETLIAIKESKDVKYKYIAIDTIDKVAEWAERRVCEKNVIMAGCDAIGYVYRNDKEELMVSFKANDAIEAGSRCPHLKGKDVKFQWNNIYKEKK